MRFPARLTLRRFAVETAGNSAVEFSIVGGIAIMLICAICQFSLLFLAGQSLDSALRSATRGLLTGSFQQANAGNKDPAILLANLRQKICYDGGSLRAVFFSCPNLKLDLRLATSFKSGSQSSPVIDTNTRDWAADFGSNYTCPPPGAIVVLRAAVKYPVFFAFLRPNLRAFADGTTLVMASSVFRTEVYESASGGGC